MDGDPGLKAKIAENLIRKSNLQQRIYDNTFAVFNELKETLHEMASEMNETLDEQLDKRVRIEYRDRGKFEAQIQVAGDILIFSMHTNVFEFNREHIIWQNSYVRDHKENSYCGIINIYNFLADSFKYNRNGDEGYLVGRIFINHENQYFVEGKRQVSLRHNSFGTRRIDREAIMDIVEAAIDYVLDFDLLVPPYDTVKVVTVDQLNTKIENSKMQTGKRMGYKFNSDDI
ncbi:hypothetical protein [Gallalistipes aquisgranensis]|uniref:hypothetical protein n=1 Tax=Gallalistipes aquisgranensis TaxID=2779358 RepID=UPI001CF8244D|nr:hypothetical protein [Gallalistipes aquisgranensis]MBE5033747.1 hypothetical protein [Gallalistipes aquisgranensis]